jgi:hypothetical protein
MSTKKQPTKHMADITKPKKPPTPAPEAQKLVIPKRPMVVPVATDDTETSTAEPIAVKRTAKSVQPENAEPGPAKTEEQPPAPAPEPAATPEPPASLAAPKDEPVDLPAPDPPEPDPKPEASPTPTSDRAHPHVRKALEDAKRQEEINAHIENRDFFVPVNAVARKRSIHVSAILIFVELLLGVLLLNLMLDAGLIELLYKIPHTNFFNVN